MVFGAISDVLHYNVSSRTLDELPNQFLGIPLLIFFEDLGALTPSFLGPLALRTFTSFFATAGINLEEGNPLTEIAWFFYDWKVSPLVAGGDMQRGVSLPAAKGGKRPRMIHSTSEAGRIDALALGSLIGKLIFSQTSLFGKSARTQLMPLCKKLYRHYYAAMLTQRETKTLNWRKDFPAELKPRVARGLGHRPYFALFTDAATSTPLIAGAWSAPSAKGFPDY